MTVAPAPPAPAFKLLRAAPAWCLGRAGNIAIILVRGRVDEDYARVVEAAMRSGEVPAARQAALMVLTPRAAPPPDTVRARVVAVLRRMDELVAAAAIVVEGEGFQASVTRSVASGVVLLARPPRPMKIFGSVSDATAWLSRELPRGSGVPAGAVVASAVDALRNATAM